MARHKLGPQSEHYGRAFRAVRECKELSTGAKYLHAVLGDFTSKEDDTCFPSQETLGEALGVQARQVRVLMRQLIDTGWVQVTLISGRRNRYTVLSPLQRELNMAGIEQPRCSSAGDPGDISPHTPVENHPLRRTREGEPEKENQRARARERPKRGLGWEECEATIQEIDQEMWDDPEFQDWWKRFKEARAGAKKGGYTASSAKKILQIIELVGADALDTALDRMIEEGWSSVFDFTKGTVYGYVPKGER